MYGAPVRVFLTGGSGFFGAHLCHALVEAGHRVTALTRDPSRLAPGVDPLRGDLRALSSLRGVLDGHDACIHNALVWGDPAEDLELLDVRASARLFAEVDDRPTLYTSSTAVHRPWTASMSAASPTRGVDLYGASKVSGEALLSALARRGVAIRPGPIVEAPAWPGAPLRLDRRVRAMVEAAARGEVLPVERSGGRQFIGAAELARLYVALLSYDGPTPRFVAVAPRLLGWVDIAREIVARVGAGSVEIIDDVTQSPVFDVTATERELAPIPDAWPALQRAIAALCLRPGTA